MSIRLFGNWRFRSNTPAFAPGEEIRAYLTGFDPVTREGRVRIGDTLLAVDGISAEQVDQLVDLRIESFDPVQSSGRATVIRAAAD